MTNILSRQQWRLIQRWFTPEQARRIAYKQQVAKWNVIAGSYQLTEQWKKYSELETRQRAIIRYAKNHWLQYDQVMFQDGRAVKKKKKITL